jgi:hypothetical protein
MIFEHVNFMSKLWFKDIYRVLDACRILRLIEMGKPVATWRR